MHDAVEDVLLENESAGHTHAARCFGIGGAGLGGGTGRGAGGGGGGGEGEGGGGGGDGGEGDGGGAGDGGPTLHAMHSPFFFPHSLPPLQHHMPSACVPPDSIDVIRQNALTSAQCWLGWGSWRPERGTGGVGSY